MMVMALLVIMLVMCGDSVLWCMVGGSGVDGGMWH